MIKVIHLAILLVSLQLLAGCDDDLQLPLDDPAYCPADPMLAECPQGTCSGPYECISYCLRYHPEGESIPGDGMGSWCDDSRVPGFGDFCRDHPEVIGCTDWCSAHPGQCGGSDGDGDSDVDSDADTDVDGDGDSDADVDEEPDGDPEVDCDDSDDCMDAEAARCVDGACVACDSDTDCTSVEGLPACVDGVCWECSPDNTSACAGETPLCDADRHLCVTCLSSNDCSGADAARCADGVCSACEAHADCEHLEGLPACEDGVCHECTTDQTDGCVGDTPLCDADAHRCVECLDESQCTTATESQCVAGACTACETDAHCSHIPGLPACDAGTCVECTADSADACTGETSHCDTDANACVECLIHSDCTPGTPQRTPRS